MIVSLLTLTAFAEPPTPACPTAYVGGYDKANPPKSIDIDVVERISKGLGCEVEIVGGALDGRALDLRFSQLDSGAADMSLYHFSVTAEREKKVDFTTPFAVDGIAVLVLEGSKVKTLDDLGDAPTIAVSLGTTAESWVNERFPKGKAVESEQGEKQLTDGTLTGIAGDASALRKSAEEPAFRLVAGYPYTKEPWAVAVKEGNTDLRDRLNKVIAAAEADGSLADIRKKWGMGAP